MIREVRHASHLEPDNERRVMCDALRVGLGEAHTDVVRASESLRHNGNNTAAGAQRWYDLCMSQATETPTEAPKDDRDVIARLADRGEQTLARLAELPGGTKAMKAVNDLRARVDELGKKVRGIDELERRVAKLEKELASMKRAQKAKTPPAAE